MPIRLPIAPVALAMTLGIASTPAEAQCYFDASRGFPVFVSAADGSVADTAFLNGAARAIAYRWQVPSSRRGEFREWSRVLNRIIPPEPRWADDWIPGDEHTARMTVTLYRDGHVTGAAPSAVSGDPAFDASLKSIVHEPLVGGPAFPALPADIKADSLVLRVAFGGYDEPQPRGVVRFAAVQTLAVLDSASMPTQRATEGPRGGRTSRNTGAFGGMQAASTVGGGSQRATVKYDIMETGEVRALSIEFFEVSDAAMQKLITDRLRAARFTPPTQNCRAVAQTVLQHFTP